jgi:hypothetical protein
LSNWTKITKMTTIVHFTRLNSSDGWIQNNDKRFSFFPFCSPNSEVIGKERRMSHLTSLSEQQRFFHTKCISGKCRVFFQNWVLNDRHIQGYSVPVQYCISELILNFSFESYDDL